MECFQHRMKENLLLLRDLKTLKNKVFKHITVFSKKIYFDVSDDIVNKYNNTVHRTIKMKPIEVAGDFYLESNKNAFNKDSMELHSMNCILIKKILNSKLVIILKVRNIKTFLLKNILQFG